MLNQKWETDLLWSPEDEIEQQNKQWAKINYEYDFPIEDDVGDDSEGDDA